MVDSVDRSSNGDSSTTSSNVRLPSNRRRMPLSSSGISFNRSSSCVRVDLEDGSERRQLLQQAPPFVHPAHALHEEALRRRRDDVRVVDRRELDLEVAGAPDERAIDRLLAAQPSELGVDDLAVAEVDLRGLRVRRGSRARRRSCD